MQAVALRLKKTLHTSLFAASALLAISLSPAFAQTANTTTIPVFALPEATEQLQTAIVSIRTKHFSLAQKKLEQITKTYPWFVEAHYILTSLHAVTGNKDAAFHALRKAIDSGFANSALLQKDTNLNSLRTDNRFQTLVEELIQKQSAPKIPVRAIQTKPASIKNGVADISRLNTTWDPRITALKTQFAFNSRKVSPPTVQSDKSTSSKMLNTLFQRGLAAGNAGDLYDNRDRNHSKLFQKAYPQLAVTKYSAEAIKANIDYGLNTKILFNAPTFGNSSTAVSSGPFWRSQARLAYTTPNGPRHLALQYFNNQLYIYPAVRDFKDSVDNLPTNTPYMIISEGKSGSDQPFLKAVASILAAFKPNEKDELIRSKKLMPAVQYILRRSLASVKTDDAYFTAKAHPAVFQSSELSYERMIQNANKLDASAFPAPAQLNVLTESKPKPGVDDFTISLPEQLFNTPAAVARVIRMTAKTKSMTLQVRSASENTGLKLNYRWVVLQGNPDKVKITPENSRKDKVKIDVDWHEPFQNANRPDFKSTRVEIGVFAVTENGVSAPSFVTFLYPKHQDRKYNKSGQLVYIDHRHNKDAYIDPQIYTRRDWRDDYRYDDNGRLVGWIRTRGSIKSEFTYHGAKIISKDTLGRATKAERIAYKYDRQNNGLMLVNEEPTGHYLNYEYLNGKDQRGILLDGS